MWKELKNYLQVLSGYSCDLWITVPNENQKLATEILQSFPHANLLKVANVGYDISPFIEVLKRVDITSYQFCVKIHSKRDLLQPAFIGLTDVSGAKWREYLLSFLKVENFSKCIKAFEQNKRLGMVGHHSLICKKEPADMKAWNHSKRWLVDYGMLSAKQTRKLAYIAGSMFMCRAHLLSPVKEILQNVEFERPSREKPSTISHVAERMLGHSITGAGYIIQDVYTPWKIITYNKTKNITLFIYNLIARFLYQKKETNRGHQMVKICKIPVYYKKLTKIKQQ